MVFSAKSRNSAGTSCFVSIMTTSSGASRALPHFRNGVFAVLPRGLIILAEPDTGDPMRTKDQEIFRRAVAGDTRLSNQPLARLGPIAAAPDRNSPNTMLH